MLKFSCCFLLFIELVVCASMKRARQEKTLAEKVELLNQLKDLPALSQREAAERLGVLRGFLQNLLKNEDAIVTEDQASRTIKRKRGGKDQEVEDALYKWFKFARSKNVPINGPIMIEKAINIAAAAHHDGFRTAEGWFSRWKKRYGIIFKTLKGKLISKIYLLLLYFILGRYCSENFFPTQAKQLKRTSVEQRSFVIRS